MEPAAFRIAVWGSTVIDLAVALVAVLGARPWRRGPRLSLARVAGALAVTAATVLAKLAVLLGLGLDPIFGVIHVVFLDLVVVLPLVAAGTLVLRRGALSRPVAGVALLALLAAPVGAYASFVEPFLLRLERTTVSLAPERRGEAPIRVGVLADIQTAEVGGHEWRAVDTLMGQRPDLIVLPGDLFQGTGARFGEELPELRRLLGRLSAPAGVFVVEGDADTLARLRRVTRGTRAQVLVNESVRLKVKGRMLELGGLRLDWRTPAARRVTRTLAQGSGTGDLRLLLSHRPDAAAEPPAGPRIDLAVAGHTHGGQIQVPGLGPLTVASQVPRSVGAGGLHRLPGGPRLYVSRGVGVERGQAPRIRFGAPPEVSVLELGGRPAR